jgi:hypothetical protein
MLARECGTWFDMYPGRAARQSGLCASITECRAGRILKTDFDEGNDEQKMQLPLIVYSASEN